MSSVESKRRKGGRSAKNQKVEEAKEHQGHAGLLPRLPYPLQKAIAAYLSLFELADLRLVGRGARDLSAAVFATIPYFDFSLVDREHGAAVITSVVKHSVGLRSICGAILLSQDTLNRMATQLELPYEHTSVEPLSFLLKRNAASLVSVDVPHLDGPSLRLLAACPKLCDLPASISSVREGTSPARINELSEGIEQLVNSASALEHLDLVTAPWGLISNQLALSLINVRPLKLLHLRGILPPALLRAAAASKSLTTLRWLELRLMDPDERYDRELVEALATLIAACANSLGELSVRGEGDLATDTVLTCSLPYAQRAALSPFKVRIEGSKISEMEIAAASVAAHFHEGLDLLIFPKLADLRVDAGCFTFLEALNHWEKLKCLNLVLDGRSVDDAVRLLLSVLHKLEELVITAGTLPGPASEALARRLSVLLGKYQSSTPSALTGLYCPAITKAAFRNVQLPALTAAIVGPESHSLDALLRVAPRLENLLLQTQLRSVTDAALLACLRLLMSRQPAQLRNLTVAFGMSWGSREDEKFARLLEKEDVFRVPQLREVSVEIDLPDSTVCRNFLLDRSARKVRLPATAPASSRLEFMR